MENNFEQYETLLDSGVFVAPRLSLVILGRLCAWH